MKLSTLETILAVGKAYNISQNSIKNIATDLPTLITESDLHLSQYALAVVEVLLEKKALLSEDIINNILANMKTLSVSSLVQGNVLQNLTSAYKAIIVNLNYSPDSLIQHLENKLNFSRKSLEITAKCIASVCGTQNKAFISKYLNNCMDSIKNNAEDINLAALCIGEIGINNDLSSVPRIAESLIELFDSKVEDTKTCASISLGKIAVGNLERFLPVIFSEFSVENHKYLLLNSIEEVISFKSEHMAPYIGQILPVLFDNSERAEENVRNMAAECLGKLISVSPEAIISHIIRCMNEGSVFCRITMVSSLKYAVYSKIPLYSAYMEQLLPSILQCFGIPDVHLRKACLISINSIAHNASSALKPTFSVIIQKILLETTVKQELIKKVDLGAFMHITDDGLPIRKAAYGLIETLLEQLPEKIDSNKILEHIIIGLDDPSDEVQMLCHQLLTKLINLGPGAVAGNLNAIIIQIRKNVEKNHKLMNNKQEVERATDILRSALRCVEKIEAQIEVESSLAFKEFLAYVSGVAELSNIIQAIKSQRESLFFI